MDEKKSHENSKNLIFIVDILNKHQDSLSAASSYLTPSKSNLPPSYFLISFIYSCLIKMLSSPMDACPVKCEYSSNSECHSSSFYER